MLYFAEYKVARVRVLIVGFESFLRLNCMADLSMC